VGIVLVALVLGCTVEYFQTPLDDVQAPVVDSAWQDTEIEEICKYKEIFEVPLQRSECIDIIVGVDTTSSMNGELSSVREDIKTFVEKEVPGYQDPLIVSMSHDPEAGVKIDITTFPRTDSDEEMLFESIITNLDELYDEGLFDERNDCLTLVLHYSDEDDQSGDYLAMGDGDNDAAIWYINNLKKIRDTKRPIYFGATVTTDIATCPDNSHNSVGDRYLIAATMFPHSVVNNICSDEEWEFPEVEWDPLQEYTPVWQVEYPILEDYFTVLLDNQDITSGCDYLLDTKEIICQNLIPYETLKGGETLTVEYIVDTQQVDCPQ
jgi:hypothetical protein